MAVDAGTLIVGGSHAGIQLASSLRDSGYGGPVAVVTSEPWMPYERPALSKSFLLGKTPINGLVLRAEAFYAGKQIELVLNQRITEVDIDAGTARTAQGLSLSFGRLALTTGARVRRLPVPGADLSNILYLRSLDDAIRMKGRMADATSVVVVGGGFIGLEAAAVTRSLGKNVTIIEAAPRLIGRAVAPIVSEFYERAHIKRGAVVMLGRKVVAFGGDGADAVQTVELDDGTTLTADLVLVGIGVEPRTELASKLGLLVAGGIVVDEFATTSHPRIVAAGDCTVFALPDRPADLIRLESVQNAVDQSKVAAATIMGRPSPYNAVPWFWSDQDDLKLQIAGLSAGYDEVVVRGSVDDEQFSSLYYRGGRLIAADCVNRGADYMVVRRALGAGKSIPADDAADIEVPLKSLVTA